MARTMRVAVAEGRVGPGMSSNEKWDGRDRVSGTKIVIEKGVRRMENSIPLRSWRNGWKEVESTWHVNIYPVGCLRASPDNLHRHLLH
jgi:hypothetical protein